MHVLRLTATTSAVAKSLMYVFQMYIQATALSGMYNNATNRVRHSPCKPECE